MAITKDTNIREMLEKHPKTVEVLFEEGIHCVGCVASQFESIGDGLKAHGKSDEEVKKIVEKLNNSVN